MRVEHAKPSAVLEKIIDESSVFSRLVFEGYDLRPAKEKCFGLHIAQREYNYNDGDAEVFLAYEGSEVLGSLTVLKSRDEESMYRGKAFFTHLRTLAPDLAEKLTEYENPLCTVAGVVVHPQYRGRGVSFQLFQAMIEMLDPAILEGQTKTPEVVSVRSKLDIVCRRTFFGKTEVTRSHPQRDVVEHLPIYQAIARARGKDPVMPEGLVHLYAGHIAATLPYVSAAPPIVQEAFQPIIAAQHRYGPFGPTVMSFLLSIHQDILK